ncbi:MAG: TolC family protein [Candidatus Omnitrophica bacterium]|nr:TolC family protein [Candidatus Omnitrophota bacterium]
MRMPLVIIAALKIAIILPFFSLTAECKTSSNPEVLQIGLEEAVKRALDTSEDFKIKEQEINRAKSIYGQVRSGILPQITAQSAWTRNTSYPDVDGKFNYDLSSSVNLSQVLWSFGKVGNAIASAEKEAEAMRFNKEIARQDIIYAAKLGYYSGLLARNTLSITEQSYKNVLESKDLLKRRSYGGRSSSYEIIRINAELAGRIPAVNESRVQFDAAVETLKRLAGIGPDCKIELRDDFSKQYHSLDYDILADIMQKRQPLFKSLDEALKSAEAKLKSERAGLLPTVSFFSGWNYAGASDKKLFLANDGKNDHYTFAGIKIDLPIWEGGNNQAQIDQAKSDREIAVLKKQQAEKDFLLELKKVFLDYQQYKDNLQANIEAVNLAQEAFKYTQNMFLSGQADISALNDAELLLTSQRINKEMTLFKINVSLARIERLIAGKDSDEKY